MRLGTVAAVVAVAITPASADPRTAKYEAAFRRGTVLFKEGKWAEARAEFETAYGIDPRPVLLFNIASTYRRAGDRVNARVYYQWYLDTVPTGELADKARITIAELDEESHAPTTPPPSPPPPPPPAPPAVDQYPRAVIDRPPTLLHGMAGAAVGTGVFPHFRTSTTPPTTSTIYDAFAVASVGYGLTDRLEIGARADVGVPDTGQTVVLASLGLGLVHDDRVTLGAWIETQYSGEFDDVLLGAALTLKLTDRIAIVSSPEQFSAAFQSPRNVYLRLPVGVGVQLTPGLYVSLSTRVFQAELRQPTFQLAFADYQYGKVALTVSPTRNLDVSALARVFDDRSVGLPGTETIADGLVVVSLRL
jgi:hypothetical protein